MVGSNCALYGCPTSRTHQFAIFKIPVVGAADGEETAAKKRNAREEWLRIILRTREKTADLQKQIDGNKIFVCERHFKRECILTCKYLPFMRAVMFINMHRICNMCSDTNKEGIVFQTIVFHCIVSG